MTTGSEDPSEPAEGATRYAEARVHYWHDRDWWGLEASAYENHTTVTAALAPLSPRRLLPDEKRTWRRRLAENLLLLGPLAVVFLLGIGIFNARKELELAGGSVLESIPAPPYVQVRETLDLPLWGYALALLFLATILVGEVLRNRRLGGPLWRMGERRRTASGGRAAWAVLLAFYTGSAVFAAVGVTLLMASGELAFDWWGIVMYLPVLVGLAAACHFLTPAGWSRPLRRLRRAVAGVPAEDLEQSAADLNAAVDFLHAQGVIDEVDARLARSAPPGELGLTMSPAPGRLSLRRLPTLESYLASRRPPWLPHDWWELEIATLALPRATGLLAGAASGRSTREPGAEARRLAAHLAALAPSRARVWIPHRRSGAEPLDLSTDAATKIRTDRDRALHRLVEYGVITPAEASLARNTLPGQLALTMAGGPGNVHTSPEERELVAQAAAALVLMRAPAPAEWECTCGFARGAVGVHLCAGCATRLLQRWVRIEDHLIVALPPALRDLVHRALAARKGDAPGRELARTFRRLRRLMPELDVPPEPTLRHTSGLASRWYDWWTLAELADRTWPEARGFHRRGPGSARLLEKTLAT